jgi:hypothetical protein
MNPGRLSANHTGWASIYSWYREDLGDGDHAVLEHVRRYARPEPAERLTVYERRGAYEPPSFYDYDWSLNEP